MALSIADIDRWNPESISAIGAASAARADAATQAGSQLKGLSTFKSWQGAASDAAQVRTQVLAFSLDHHGQEASTVAAAASTAANEVRQIKSQLNSLRSTLGRYGIVVDGDGSRVVPPPNLSSMSPANAKLVQDMTIIGQQSLDKIRQAADMADTHLADALKAKDASKGKGASKRDDFDLDPQFVRTAVGGPMPAGTADLTPSTQGCVIAITMGGMAMWCNASTSCASKAC